MPGLDMRAASPRTPSVAVAALVPLVAELLGLSGLKLVVKLGGAAASAALLALDLKRRYGGGPDLRPWARSGTGSEARQAPHATALTTTACNHGIPSLIYSSSRPGITALGAIRAGHGCFMPFDCNRERVRCWG
ncbi:hypothetical protein EJB05_01590, partial [Eragrostis curvula]